MDISGISSSDALSGSSGLATQSLDRDAFMQLLVTQLQNQDPLEPTKNEEFVAQLASFSSLEQLQGLNDSILAMIALNQGNALLAQLTQSSALIGKSVTWIDPATGSSQSGVVDSVKISDGIATLSISGTDVPLATVTEILADSGTEEGA